MTMTIDCSRKGCLQKLQGRWNTRSCLFLSAYCLLELISFLILASNPQLLEVLQGPAILAKKNNRKLEVKHIEIKSAAKATVELPPLEELIDENGNVIGDISWMLDFAIIAFPKAGTTFMKDYLNKPTETYVYEREFCMKHESDVSDFVKEYYELHAQFKQPKFPKTMQFGLKCPGVFYRAEDIHIYERYFPNTKFIIGLRDPVSWFESFYNYQLYRNVSLPDTSQLIGRCVDHQKVCTDRARMHAALARLGMTPMREDRELSLLLGLRYDEQQSSSQESNTHEDMYDPRHGRHLRGQQGLPNKVLLYEVRQIHDEDISWEISESLRQYLGIQEALPEILPYEQSKTRAINICDEEHDEVRELLVEHGKDASAWIKEYFLNSPKVVAASRDSFDRLLRDWEMDPCRDRSSLRWNTAFVG